MLIARAKKICMRFQLLTNLMKAHFNSPKPWPVYQEQNVINHYLHVFQRIANGRQSFGALATRLAAAVSRAEFD